MTEVVCAVIRSEKGYLIAQKKESLLWEFPGGKVQDGETNNQALIREIKEELALDIEPLFEITRYDYDKYNLIFIEAIVSGEGCIKLQEHESVKWVELNEINQYPFVSGDKKFLDYIILKNQEER